MEAQLFVEATLIGVALSRLSLLATKQDVFNVVRDRSPQTEQAI